MVQAFGVALRLDVDAFGVVADQPGEAVPTRQGVDEGSEAHALHDAPDGDPPPLLYRRSHEVSSHSTTLHVPYVQIPRDVRLFCMNTTAAPPTRARNSNFFMIHLLLAFSHQHSAVSSLLAVVSTHLLYQRLDKLRGFFHRLPHRLAQLH